MYTLRALYSAFSLHFKVPSLATTSTKETANTDTRNDGMSCQMFFCSFSVLGYDLAQQHVK